MKLLGLPDRDGETSMWINVDHLVGVTRVRRGAPPVSNSSPSSSSTACRRKHQNLGIPVYRDAADAA